MCRRRKRCYPTTHSLRIGLIWETSLSQCNSIRQLKNMEMSLGIHMSTQPNKWLKLGVHKIPSLDTPSPTSFVRMLAKNYQHLGRKNQKMQLRNPITTELTTITIDPIRYLTQYPDYASQSRGYSSHNQLKPLEWIIKTKSSRKRKQSTLQIRIL